MEVDSVGYGERRQDLSERGEMPWDQDLPSYLEIRREYTRDATHYTSHPSDGHIPIGHFRHTRVDRAHDRKHPAEPANLEQNTNTMQPAYAVVICRALSLFIPLYTGYTIASHSLPEEIGDLCSQIHFHIDVSSLTEPNT